jgi:hypothetical protein
MVWSRPSVVVQSIGRLVLRVLLLSGLAIVVGGTVARAPAALALVSYPAGALDAPAAGSTVSGGVSVHGWAIDVGAPDSSGVDLVEIIVDGVSRGPAVYGRDRADIGAAYGPRFTRSGFLFMLDTASVGGGAHSIEARARSTVSGASSTYRTSIQVSGPTAPVGPIPTPVPTRTPTAPTVFPKQFGVNAHLTWTSTQQAVLDVERARAAGLQSVRFDVSWTKLEPTGKRTWSPAYLAQIDAAVEAVTSRGLGAVLILTDTPGWARGYGGTGATPPTRVEDYADVLGFVAARYASRARMAYEVWNEPNQVTFWNAPGGPDALTYARMLRASHASIKAAAPAATVVGGAVAFNDQTFLHGLYAFGGIAGHYDALSLHPYSLGFHPDSAADGYHTFRLAVEQTLQLMAQYGESHKPLWITEMGWSTDYVSDAERGLYLRRAVEMARGWPQVAVFQVFALNQAEDGRDVGMIAPGGHSTSSWMAYASAAGRRNDQVSGAVDTPHDWLISSHDILVAGWAIDEAASGGTGIDRVEVYLNGAYSGDASLGYHRPDVGAAYGPRFAASGFMFPLRLSGVTPGHHIVEVRIRSAATGAHTTFVRAVTRA